MIIQFFIILFILFVISRIFLRYRQNDITGREFFLWLIFWAVVATAVLWPKKTDFVAQLVGVERGADLLVYLSILVIFFIVFKILVRLEKINRDITDISRFISLTDKTKKDE